MSSCYSIYVCIVIHRDIMSAAQNRLQGQGSCLKFRGSEKKIAMCANKSAQQKRIATNHYLYINKTSHQKMCRNANFGTMNFRICILRFARHILGSSKSHFWGSDVSHTKNASRVVCAESTVIRLAILVFLHCFFFKSESQFNQSVHRMQMGFARS